MTADIKARVVATDRLVVNFKMFPLSCNGKVTSTNRANKSYAPICSQGQGHYYRMLLVINVSGNALFFKKKIRLLCHICLKRIG